MCRSRDLFSAMFIRDMMVHTDVHTDGMQDAPASCPFRACAVFDKDQPIEIVFKKFVLLRNRTSTWAGSLQVSGWCSVLSRRSRTSAVGLVRMRLYLIFLHQSDYRKLCPHSTQDHADQHGTLTGQGHAASRFLRRNAHHRHAAVSPQWSCKILMRSIAWFSMTDLHKWLPENQMKTGTRVHIESTGSAQRTSSTTMLQIGVSFLMSLQCPVERAACFHHIKSVSVWSDRSDDGTSCVCTHVSEVQTHLVWTSQWNHYTYFFFKWEETDCNQGCISHTSSRDLWDSRK